MKTARTLLLAIMLLPATCSILSAANSNQNRDDRSRSERKESSGNEKSDKKAKVNHSQKRDINTDFNRIKENNKDNAVNLDRRQSSRDNSVNRNRDKGNRRGRDFDNNRYDNRRDRDLDNNRYDNRRDFSHNWSWGPNGRHDYSFGHRPIFGRHRNHSIEFCPVCFAGFFMNGVGHARSDKEIARIETHRLAAVLDLSNRQAKNIYRINLRYLRDNIGDRIYAMQRRDDAIFDVLTRRQRAMYANYLRNIDDGDLCDYCYSYR